MSLHFSDVDLNIFIEFNKIRELTTDISRITKALQASTILSLSEDGTKVHRITPIVPKENTDDCTIYVQNLPPDADHETLSSIFSQYGPVVYVSLPRYKHNRKIKGFAFVEFDTPESIKKCFKVKKCNDGKVKFFDFIYFISLNALLILLCRLFRKKVVYYLYTQLLMNF